MDILLLNADLPFNWIDLGFGGVIAFMFFFMVRHLVNSQVKTNEAIAAAVTEIPKILNELKSAFEKGDLIIHQKLDRNFEILKEIKSEIKNR